MSTTVAKMTVLEAVGQSCLCMKVAAALAPGLALFVLLHQFQPLCARRCLLFASVPRCVVRLSALFADVLNRLHQRASAAQGVFLLQRLSSCYVSSMLLAILMVRQGILAAVFM